MNRFVFALALFAASTACAETAYVRRNPPAIEWFGTPAYVDVPGRGRAWDPDHELLIANGWEAFEYGGNPLDAVWDPTAPVAVRDMTQQELDDRAAAQAAAQAEADAQAAAYTFPAPEVVVPVLDADGERTGTARLLVDSAGQIVAVTDTASPQRTAAVQLAEFKAKRDAAAAKLAKAKAAANGQLQKRIENIESVLGIRE